MIRAHTLPCLVFEPTRTRIPKAAEDFHRRKGGDAPYQKRYLDIGANLGYFSLLAASRGYEARVALLPAKSRAIL